MTFTKPSGHLLDVRLLKRISLYLILTQLFSVVAAAAAAVNPFLDESMAGQNQFYGATGNIQSPNLENYASGAIFS